MSNADTLTRPHAVDITTHAFARRFGALLREHRLASGRSVREVARAADGRITARELRRIEAAEQPLGIDRIGFVAALYGADLEALTPQRMGVTVRDGVIASGPAERPFDPADPDALLAAYLDLVRSLRRERDSILVLRRDDVDMLADHLHTSGKDVLERLLTMMGSTRSQRSAVLALFATGVMVIGLVSSASAADRDATVESPVTTIAGTTTQSVAESTVAADAPVAPTATTMPATAPSAPTATTVASTAPTVAPVTTVRQQVGTPPIPTSPPATAAPEPTVAPPPSTTLVPPLVDAPPPDQGTDTPPIPGG